MKKLLVAGLATLSMASFAVAADEKDKDATEEKADASTDATEAKTDASADATEATPDASADATEATPDVSADATEPTEESQKPTKKGKRKKYMNPNTQVESG